MSEFNSSELAAATGGRWLTPPPALLRGISTDTRQAGDGKLFLALAGERFDAHDFLAGAVDANYAALCIEEGKLGKLPAGCPAPVLAVENTLDAYQKIARLHRRRFPDLTVVAVTGSVGKTSVKEMLRAIFTAAAGEDQVLYTIGNTNNQVGVPQNLLRLTKQHRYAVIEMGTNHHGEIEPLSRCAEPQAAIVNTVAPCHLEFLGSLEGVATEKSKIFTGLVSGGTAVIPAECPAREVLAAAAEPFRQLCFGKDCRGELLDGDLGTSTFRLTFPAGETFDVTWSLTGEHQVANASAAALAALAASVPPAVIAAGLAGTRLPGMRSKITVINNVTYFNDAYNANPASMRASFELLKANRSRYTGMLLILGEMRELGPEAPAAHAETLRLARHLLPGARIFTVGEGFRASPGDRHFPTPEAAAPEISATPGEVVFAKGSRGIAVELSLPEEAR